MRLWRELGLSQAENSRPAFQLGETSRVSVVASLWEVRKQVIWFGAWESLAQGRSKNKAENMFDLVSGSFECYVKGF